MVNCYGKYNSKNIRKVECAKVLSGIDNLHGRRHNIQGLLNIQHFQHLLLNL